MDSRGAISVPGFYDDVRGGMLDAALARLEATAEFDLASYQAALGIPSFTKDTSKRCVLQSCRWLRTVKSNIDDGYGVSVSSM